MIVKIDNRPPMKQSDAFKADLARHPEAIRSRPPPLPDIPRTWPVRAAVEKPGVDMAGLSPSLTLRELRGEKT